MGRSVPEASATPALGRPLARHLRLVGASLRISVLRAFEYRVGFWTDAVLGVFWSLAGMAPLLVALEHRPDVAGWTPWEVVILTGFYMVLSGSFAGALEPALFATMDHIRRGTLDYLLLRPVDSLVSCLTSAFSPWSALEVATGVGLIIGGAAWLGLRPGPVELAMLAATLASGFAALYALGVLIISLSFRALQLQNLAYLAETAIHFARWPIDAFRGPLRMLFTFVIPFAVMTSFPAQALLGELTIPAIAGALTTAIVLAALARLSWHRALRNYTSASS